ncbi:MAG: pitrilysin family protein [Acidobacteriota bacterium]
MRKFTLVLLVFTVLVYGTGIFGKGRKLEKIKYPPLNEIQKPVVKSTQLNNGIKIKLIEDQKFPVVNFTAYLKGGDVYDPAGKTGLASVTAQLLRIGGAAGIKGAELDRMLDMSGISISFGSSFDYYTINVSALKPSFGKAMDILSKMLESPVFDKDKFEEIKSQFSSSISRSNDDPASIRNREFGKLIYGKGSPFAAQLEYEHLENITLNDVRKFYSMFFKPGNMMIGVTGPFKIEELEPTINKHFGQLKGNPVIPVYPVVKTPEHGFNVYFAEKADQTQSQIVVGHPGYKENIDEKAKILVFNSIFSQGFNSRLMQRLRVKMGLTYGVGGGINSEYLYPGDVSFTTFTKSESTITAVSAILDEIKRIRTEKVTEKELNEAKDYFLNSYVFKFSSPEKVLNDHIRKEFYNLDKAKYDDLVNKIKTVTADDVLKAAQKYLVPEKIVTLIVGTKKNVKEDLAKLGKVKDIDISIKPPPVKEIIPEATPASLKKGNDILFKALMMNYSGYRNIKTAVKDSTMNITLGPRSFNLEQSLTVVYPDKIYSETKVMGMTMKRVVNGKKGYMTQMGQRKELTEEEIEESGFAGLYDIFHSKGKYKFQYLRTEEIKGISYDVVYITGQKDKWVKFFINNRTGLIEIKEKIENIGGQKGLGRIYLSLFKKQKGISFPFKTEIFMKDKKVVDITMKKVVINSIIDKSLFKVDTK